MGCTSSLNLICKHVLAVKSFYLDLDNQLQPGVTIDSAVATSTDEELDVGDATVIDENVTIDGDEDCEDVTLLAGRAIIVEIGGGTPSDEETIVTVAWEQSDGEMDARDVRLIISGTAAE